MHSGKNRLDSMLSVYLDLHAKAWAQLRMVGKITEQNNKDYQEFCEVLKEVHKKHGYNFYRKIDEALPNNTWLPLFRKNAHLLNIEEVSKRVNH